MCDSSHRVRRLFVAAAVNLLWTASVAAQDDCPPPADPQPAELVWAFSFGAQARQCPTYNDPSVDYTRVVQNSPAAIAYDEGRGWGFEVTDESQAGTYFQFGKFDESPNTRSRFPDSCPEQLYDEFIGAKTFSQICDEFTAGDLEEPCTPETVDGYLYEGIVFRADVEPGHYRFVLAAGSADNPHAHRFLAQDGGEGALDDGASLEETNWVTLVHNFDQAQSTIGETDGANTGWGVYARVGFDGKIPPPGDGVRPDPQFVNMDEEGFATEDCPSSPTLEVVEGHIRVHGLQANSNAGPGGALDGNGADLIVLEIWRVDVPSAAAVFKRGDVDANGTLEITDPINSLAFQFLGDFQPSCMDALDFDDNGSIEVTDPISSLTAQFLGGPVAPAPGSGSCGADPTEDGLDCEAYPETACN